jgi:peptide deformylase
MSKLEIKIYPDKILRKKASPVSEVSSVERKLAYDMIETMRSAKGVGLAAPQVGISKRIIVAEDTEGDNKLALVLVNPKITNKKGKVSFCEGCLSMPGITSDVVRPEFITVEALNLDNDKLKIHAEGLLARIIQHEIDHLDGVLFIDRIGFLKRKKIIRQLGAKVCMEF